MPGLDVTYAGALVAGLLSFLSPCVLPLVPPYICFLGGVSLEELSQERAQDKAAHRRVLIAATAFVFGFATVFVALGATASAVSGLIAENIDLLAKIAGAIIIILGLHFLGLFRIGLLYREARFHVARRPAGVLGAYAVGLAFAFGWTPCVGPVLAAILFVAGSADSLVYGATLLGAYALGIGIPFLAAALAFRPFMSFMRRFSSHVRHVEMAIGGLLVATGLLFISGSVPTIAYWLLEAFPVLGRVG